MSVSRISTGSSSRSVVSSAKLGSTQGPAAVTNSSSTAGASHGEAHIAGRASDDLLRVVVGLGTTGVAGGLKTVDSTDGANFVVSNPLQRTGSSLARQPHTATTTASSAPAATSDVGGDDNAPGGALDLSTSLHVPHATLSSSSGGSGGAGERSSQSRWPAPRSGNASAATGLEGFRSQRVGKAMRLGPSSSTPPGPAGGHTQQHE